MYQRRSQLRGRRPRVTEKDAPRLLCDLRHGDKVPLRNLAVGALKFPIADYAPRNRATPAESAVVVVARQFIQQSL